MGEQADEPSGMFEMIFMAGHFIRFLERQNQPMWVWFVGEEGVETELPKTASGKVQKHILREWASRWAKAGIGRV